MNNNVPYTGSSVPDRSQSSLSDNQLQLLTRLSQVCEQRRVEGQETARKSRAPGYSQAGGDGALRVNQKIDSELKEKFSSRGETSMQAFRQSLPCFKLRSEILQEIKENQGSLYWEHQCL